MRQAQNHKRWAIDQQKKAHAVNAAKRLTELSQEQAVRDTVREWCNIFFGAEYTRLLRSQS